MLKLNFSKINNKAFIYTKEYQEFGTYYDAEIPGKLYALFAEYDLDTMVS